MPQVVGKDKICICRRYTDHFKSIQGLEGHTLFQRYEAIDNIVVRYILPEFRHFLAQPVVEGEDISWFAIRYSEAPKLFSELTGDERERYAELKNRSIEHFKQIEGNLRQEGKDKEALCLEGALKFINDKFLFCYDNKVVLGIWGMQLKEHVREASGVFEKAFTAAQGPRPPVPGPANPPDVFYRVRFQAETGGALQGATEIRVKENEQIQKSHIPEPSADEGYEFDGWDIDPECEQITGDKVFIARFKSQQQDSPGHDSDGPLIVPPIPPSPPWWKRIRDWLRGAGCFKWLLYFLLFLLLLLLLMWLFKGCNSETPRPIPSPISEKPWVKEDSIVRGGIYNPGNPYKAVPRPPEYTGILPPEQGVLPPVDTAAIIHEPGRPGSIANRLNILMENTDKSIMDFAREFKKVYPEDKYKVVYYDDVVKRLQIEVPEQERARLKSEIPAKFAPSFILFVFDESLFEGVYAPADPAFAAPDKSWYLKAIRADAAWDISKGSSTLTMAVIDDGFSLKHPELKDKVVMPYNVWTHSSEVFPQNEDHGTHVAGTALAVMDNGEGLCGIAPACAFMPVQVADANGVMTTTSVLDGVLYALYQGADVVNVSLGAMYLTSLPGNIQQELQDNHFKEEERLWNFIMKIADKHNAMIVTAAGNENMLAGIDPMHRPKNFIVVSATDQANNSLLKAPFSNYGDYTTVSAPGTNIFSSVGRGDYTFMSGTSMAAPIVSGAVALMKSINSTLTAHQIICILQQTGLPLNGNIGPLLQLDKALQMVKSGTYGDCDSRPAVPTSGDVQVLLSWNNYNDLDLACMDPNGEVVWFKNRRVTSGGRLEIDMNVDPNDSPAPIENIYWPQDGAPLGNYEVFIWLYKQHEITAASSHYKLNLLYGGKKEVIEGDITAANGRVSVARFTLGTETNAGIRGRMNSQPDTQLHEQLRRRRNELLQELDTINKKLNIN